MFKVQRFTQASKYDSRRRRQAATTIRSERIFIIICVFVVCIGFFLSNVCCIGCLMFWSFILFFHVYYWCFHQWRISELSWLCRVFCLFIPKFNPPVETVFCPTRNRRNRVLWWAELDCLIPPTVDVRI